ncbi:MAG: methyltransferase domain-containing protein [Burkholderiales bacterium]|nr:methyltransferase domain-containing protein [Burkholderiales bacterium]
MLDAIPAGAGRILDLGSWGGQLGAWLKADAPERVVYGVVDARLGSMTAAPGMDRVFSLDLEVDTPDIEPGSLDCVIVGDVLEQVRDPSALLRRYAALLKPSGEMVCCVSNAQHVSVLCELIGGDYRNVTSQEARRHRFTWFSLIELVLDAGLEPEIRTYTWTQNTEAVIGAAAPLIRCLGVAPDRAEIYLSAYQYVLSVRPRNWEAGETDTPLTFVACVNDEAQLRANLLRSPCLQPGSPHQLIAVRNAPSAAAGLNYGLDHAEHEIVVLLHQDVYLPAGWTKRFLAQYRQAVAELGAVDLVGVFGARSRDGTREHVGRIVDRHQLLQCAVALPTPAQTVDEVLMAVPKRSKLRFDPALGWHLYGADLAMQVRANGGQVAVIDAVCFHHSKGSFVLPADYNLSTRTFTAKWQDKLPIFTPCMTFRTVGDAADQEV